MKPSIERLIEITNELKVLEAEKDKIVKELLDSDINEGTHGDYVAKRYSSTKAVLKEDADVDRIEVLYPSMVVTEKKVNIKELTAVTEEYTDYKVTKSFRVTKKKS